MSKNILVIAPHADDETIGMGGTIARFAEEGNNVSVAVMTGHGEDIQHPLYHKNCWEVVRSELKESCRIMGVAHIIYKEIPAAMVSDQPVYKINSITKSVIDEANPEILFVPFIFDLHKDHRELFHSFSVHWRPHLDIGKKIKEVFAYETASETHLNFPYVEQGFIPNTWIDISDHIHTKIRALQCYKSQLQDHPSIRSISAIKALASWRGAQIGVDAAEAFVLVRSLK
jgi:N-acetylglucosamine malate deacetylase 1